MTELKQNELIAEFMSMEDHQEMGEYVTPNYHKSWDWLMPVVEEIADRKKWSLNYTLEWLSESQGRDGLYDIRGIFQAVVEFIVKLHKNQRKEDCLKYLNDRGYAVGSLWHIDDVQQGYHCDSIVAKEMLNVALESDNVCEAVFEAIDYLADNEYKIKKKE